MSRQKSTDHELYCAQIDWLLTVAPSALGARGTLAGTISSLERGGSSGTPSSELPDFDNTVGWCPGDGHVERWRKLQAIWARISSEHRYVLRCHYEGPKRIDGETRARVDGAMGKVANAALLLHQGEALEKLLDACRNGKREGRKTIIRAAIERTEKIVREAHRDWYAVAEMKPEGMPSDGGRIDPKPFDEAGWLRTFNENTAANTTAAMLRKIRYVEAVCRLVTRPTRPEQRALAGLTAGMRRLSGYRRPERKEVPRRHPSHVAGMRSVKVTDAALDVRCATCDAKPGVFCRIIEFDGIPGCQTENKVHVARQHQAEEMRRGGSHAAA